MQTTGENKGCVCARVSCTVPCHHPAFCVTPRLIKCPWARRGGSLAGNQIWEMLVPPCLPHARLALMAAGKLSRIGGDPHSMLPAATMHPYRGFWDPDVCTAIQLRKRVWYLCHIFTDVVKYLTRNFEKKNVTLLFSSYSNLKNNLKKFIHIKQKNKVIRNQTSRMLSQT